MSRDRGGFTKEARGIIKIYGQVLESEHDWHDTDYLESLILSKFDRETAITALTELLDSSEVLRSERGKELKNPGEMMEAFIQTRMDRFVWEPGDLVFTVECPHCSGNIEYRQDKPETCTNCHKDF